MRLSWATVWCDHSFGSFGSALANAPNPGEEVWLLLRQHPPIGRDCRSASRIASVVDPILWVHLSFAGGAYVTHSLP